MRLKILLLVWLASLISSLFLSQDAFAARVAQVKGKQVAVELEGDSTQVGDKHFVIVGGKKRGLITITEVKGTRAKATLDKGKAEVNATLSLARAAGAKTSAAKPASKKRGRQSYKGTTFGILGGYSMDSQTAKLIDPTRTQTIDVKMSGSGFSLVGFADIPYSGNLGIIGRGGVEMFNVEGTAAQPYCSGTSTQCSTEITYFTLDALLRLKFGSPWIGAGIGIYYPISKATTALNPDIGMSTVFLFAAGYNLQMSGGSYIPITVQYGLFPPGPDVSTNIISVRAGYGFAF